MAVETKEAVYARCQLFASLQVAEEGLRRTENQQGRLAAQNKIDQLRVLVGATPVSLKGLFSNLSTLGFFSGLIKSRR
jgi:hypothetical protein